MILFDFLSLDTTAHSSFDEIPTDLAVSHVFWASSKLYIGGFGVQPDWREVFRGRPRGLDVLLHIRGVNSQGGGGSTQAVEVGGETATSHFVVSSVTMGSTHTGSTQ